MRQVHDHTHRLEPLVIKSPDKHITDAATHAGPHRINKYLHRHDLLTIQHPKHI